MINNNYNLIPQYQMSLFLITFDLAKKDSQLDQ